LNDIQDEFKDQSLNSILSAYFLDLPIQFWGRELIEPQITMVKNLLNSGLFIHGEMEVSSPIAFKL
jgi:hypothetical protein